MACPSYQSSSIFIVCLSVSTCTTFCRHGMMLWQVSVHLSQVVLWSFIKIDEWIKLFLAQSPPTAYHTGYNMFKENLGISKNKHTFSGILSQTLDREIGTSTLHVLPTTVRLTTIISLSHWAFSYVPYYGWDIAHHAGLCAAAELFGSYGY